MTQNVIQPSFAAGELSPKLYARVDQAMYRVGARKMMNFFVHPAGGASNRPGTEFVGAVKDSAVRGRLIPFQFNTQHTYVLEFGDKVMRVIKDGGYVLGQDGPFAQNGEFQSDITGWSDVSTAGGGSASIAWDSGENGRLKLTAATGGTARARQALTGLVIGGRYTVTLDWDGGTCNIGTEAGGNDLGSADFAAASQSFVFTATATTASLDLVFTNAAAAASTYVRSISVIGLIANPTQIYELPAPYAAADLALLKYTQSADVMTFCHPDYRPQDLSRTGDAGWFFTPLTFAPTITRPTLDTLTVATGGSVTYRYKVTALNPDGTEESLPGIATGVAITAITAARPVVVHTDDAHKFANGDEIYIDSVGGMTQLNGKAYLINVVDANNFELRDLNNNNIDGRHFDAYTAGGTASPCFLITKAAATLSSTATITVKWIGQANVSKYNVYRELSGTFGIIGSSNSTSFKDDNIKPDTSNTPPGARDPFEDGNWPSTVAYHEQRKFFANSTQKPQTLWATQTGNFKNMNVSSPTKDDDAITRTLVSSQVNAIRHMVSMNVLILLTSGAEWKCYAGSNGDAITPASCYTKPQSYNGSSDVQPIVSNNAILYIQEKGSVVRDLLYDFATDSYSGTDRSVWADHLFYGHTIREWGYAQEPFRITWAVREDGVLLGFTYMREQQVFGWHRHATDGFFESIVVISENGEDVPYFIVRREIDGETRRYVERLHSRLFEDVADAWFLDCALQYDGEPTMTVSNLDHLEGKTVGVLGDGNVFPNAVVMARSRSTIRSARSPSACLMRRSWRRSTSMSAIPPSRASARSSPPSRSRWRRRAA